MSKTTEMKFEALKRIEANQKDIIGKQNQHLQIVSDDLANKNRQLALKEHQFTEHMRAEVRRNIEQSVEFSIASLPWWNRSVASVMKRARIIQEEISKTATIQASAISAHIQATLEAEKKAAEEAVKMVEETGETTE